MRRIIHSTQAYKDANEYSNEYLNGRMTMEMYRLYIIKCIINFSPDELRALVDAFIDEPSGEG